MTYRYSSSYAGKDTPNGKVLTIMGRIEECYKQNQLHLLIFLLDMSYRNFADSYARIRLPKPIADDNLSNTIYQKLVMIKAKNHQYKIKLLNLQATFSKLYCNNRKDTYEKKYQEAMGRIREKSYSIREKLSQLRKSKIPNRIVLNSEGQRGRKVVSELMQVTEALSHETLKVRAQFSTLREMFPEIESD